MIKAILKYIIDVQLYCLKNYNWFTNKGNFIQSDKLTYNWKAKIYIDTVVRDNKQAYRIVDKIIHDGETIYFTDGSSSSVFWQRKLSKREIEKADEWMKGFRI